MFKKIMMICFMLVVLPALCMQDEEEQIFTEKSAREKIIDTKYRYGNGMMSNIKIYFYRLWEGTRCPELLGNGVEVEVPSLPLEGDFVYTRGERSFYLLEQQKEIIKRVNVKECLKKPETKVKLILTDIQQITLKEGTTVEPTSWIVPERVWAGIVLVTGAAVWYGVQYLNASHTTAKAN